MRRRRGQGSAGCGFWRHRFRGKRRAQAACPAAGSKRQFVRARRRSAVAGDRDPVMGIAQGSRPWECAKAPGYGRILARRDVFGMKIRQRIAVEIVGCGSRISGQHAGLRPGRSEHAATRYPTGSHARRQQRWLARRRKHPGKCRPYGTERPQRLTPAASADRIRPRCKAGRRRPAQVGAPARPIRARHAIANPAAIACPAPAPDRRGSPTRPSPAARHIRSSACATIRSDRAPVDRLRRHPAARARR